jgi:DNA-binding transcriptional MerR regulator/bifunctional DNase/RNase
MNAGGERRWKVGELARATGLTVRALHHYDQLGLLAPSERTGGGHRLYCAHDVQRLYRILALRDVGLPLAEIGAVLDADAPDLLTTVRRHLARIERELQRSRRLRERLLDLLGSLEHWLEPSVDQFIEAMEAMAVIETDVDVVMRVPYETPDEESGPPRVKTRYPGQKVVLLEERGGGRTLPIWVGSEAGYALVLGLCGHTLERPLSTELSVRLLGLWGARVERVLVERGSKNRFDALLTISGGDETHELDARPSDALNIAARTGAPVFADAGLMDERGMSPRDDLLSMMTRDLARIPDSDADLPGEWRSLPKDLASSLRQTG